MLLCGVWRVWSMYVEGPCSSAPLCQSAPATACARASRLALTTHTRRPPLAATRRLSVYTAAACTCGSAFLPTYSPFQSTSPLPASFPLPPQPLAGFHASLPVSHRSRAAFPPPLPIISPSPSAHLPTPSLHPSLLPLQVTMCTYLSTPILFSVALK